MLFYAFCQFSAKCNAYVMYISTDYVFDGVKPPFKVTSEPNPLNAYGASKLAGEKIVLQSSPGKSACKVQKGIFN